MQLLNFNFVMIYIIHQVLVLLKNHLNYLKDNSSTIHFFFKKNFFFWQHGERNKTWVEQCLNKIRPYLKGIIDNLKKSDPWKTQLKMANNLFLP